MKLGILISLSVWVVVLGLAAVISGCASFDAAQTLAVDRAARVADETRQTAEWTLCNAISVGAWRRAYAADPVKADGWRRLCVQPSGAPQ